MTYQNELANRQTAHRLRPARILVSKWAPALLLYGAPAGSWLGQRLCKFLCFYASRADLAKQRRQLLKCRNGSFAISGLILLPPKPRPKNHHGALNRPGKRRNGKRRNGKSRSGTNWSGDHSRGVSIDVLSKTP